MIHGHNLPPTLQLPAAGESARQGLLRLRVELLERDMIADALKSCQGSVSMAAEQLGITPRMVRYKMKKLGIDHRLFCGPRTQLTHVLRSATALLPYRV